MMNACDPAPGERASNQAADLFAGVAAHGHQHLDEVAGDLLQMEALLDAAIRKLATAFMSLHAALARQQAVLDLQAEAGHSAAECSAALQPLREEIERHIGAAVTGLQFQDMASQLMRRMTDHLGGVREIFGTLDTHAEAFAVHEPALAPLNERLALHGATLATHASRKVAQDGMDSGDIELF
jgi:hypothetical protein